MQPILTVVLGIAAWYDRIRKDLGVCSEQQTSCLQRIGLLAVAAWLGNMGKNNKMFLFPMAFMLVVTIVSLCQTIHDQLQALQWQAPARQCGAGPVQALDTLLVILAIVLAVEGVQTIAGKKKAAK